MSDAPETVPGAVSPFAQHEARLEHSRGGGGMKIALWIGAGFVLAAVLAFAGFHLKSTLADPFRTLEEFPADKYLENYQALTGARFKADLRVENELGWKEGVGKLMVMGTENSRRSLPVLISPEIAATVFTKGQLYRFELEVREGGLLYGTRCKKL